MRATTDTRSLKPLLGLFFALLLAVAPAVGCAAVQEEAGNTAEAGGEHAAGAGEHEAGAGEHAEGGEGDEGDGEHVHPAGDETPSRADEEDRDEYSRPLEVFALTSVGEGSTVVDIGAGSGYNTYLLSGVVGDDGEVLAVRGNDGLAARLEHGDLMGRDNVVMHASTSEIADGSTDAVLMIREFHLAQDRPGVLAETMRILKPGGMVAVVEVRLGGGEREGYNHDVHRSGEDTIIGEFADAGFELVEESDVLYRDDDDYAVYGGPMGLRYATDRMLLIFRKAE